MRPSELVRPPRRMGLLPPVTIQGPFGLATGECWWLGMDTLSFLSVEWLHVETVVELRVDQGGGRSPLYLRARIHTHAKGRHPRGFLHAATFEPTGTTTLDHVEAAVRRLNPDAAPRRRSPIEQAQQEEERGRRLPGTTRRPPPGPTPATQPPTAIFDRGPPATMLIAFDRPALLKAHARLEGREPRIVLPAVAGPRRGELLMLAIRLPSGLFVQADAEVGVADQDTLELRLVGASKSLLAQLRHEAG